MTSNLLCGKPPEFSTAILREPFHPVKEFAENRALHFEKRQGTMEKEFRRRGEKAVASNCEECVFYDYDQEAELWFCTVDLDEDEMERFLRRANDSCPYYRRDGEYRTARRQ